MEMIAPELAAPSHLEEPRWSGHDAGELDQSPDKTLLRPLRGIRPTGAGKSGLARDVAPTEFGTILAALDVTQRYLGELFDVDQRQVRRWRRGDRRVPRGVGIVFRLLAAKVITLSQ